MPMKSSHIFYELEEKFGFVGGSEYEYIQYFHRKDVKRLWEWVPAGDVRAFCGFNAVWKADLIHQRKILIPVAKNMRV